MELADGAETMALDGGQGSRDGRPSMRGITAEDERRIYYYVLWPTTFLSIHPDYLLVHRLVPARPGPDDRRAATGCSRPTRSPRPDSTRPTRSPSGTSPTRQDWHVCELQQRGTRSSSWVAGRYSNQEASVHAFDQMVADRYAGEAAFVTKRIVRERYDQPVPKDEIGPTNGRRRARRRRRASDACGASQGGRRSLAETRPGRVPAIPPGSVRRLRA